MYVASWNLLTPHWGTVSTKPEQLHFVVQAYNDYGMSPKSAEISGTPSPSFPCTYAISPTSAAVGAGSAGGSVAVSTSAGCAWAASSSTSWVTITTGASGSGSGSVTYAVLPNGSTQPRIATLTIAGQSFVVNQAGAACSHVLSPTSAAVGAGSAGGSVAVSTSAGCAWAASSSTSWVTITAGASGSGSGSVTYTVLPNGSTQPRIATLTIAGQSFVVNQADVSRVL